jgi:hypothetical protein
MGRSASRSSNLSWTSEGEERSNQPLSPGFHRSGQFPLQVAGGSDTPARYRVFAAALFYESITPIIV